MAGADTIASVNELYHAAEADHREARQEQETSRQLARHAMKRATAARSAKLEALITLAMTPAESLTTSLARPALCGRHSGTSGRLRPASSPTKESGQPSGSL